MMYFRYIARVPFLVAMNVFVYLTAEIWAALSVIMKRNTLPGFLALLHTTDDTLDGMHNQIDKPLKTGVGLVLQRAMWMRRNPAAGFQERVLGFKSDGAVFTYSNQRETPRGNWYHRSIMRAANGKRYFGFRCHVYWSKKFAVKLWIGWAYHDYGTGYHPMKLDFNPFKTSL